MSVKIVTIIQARMGSTRLPGKVMKDLGGETVLARVVNRGRRAQLTRDVVVATSRNSADNLIAEECRRLSVPCFRGEEEDVLDRYYRAAKLYAADAVVRICADSPMIEPEVCDCVIRQFLDHRPDYASNTVLKTYPLGLDTEIMSTEALTQAWRAAKESYQRAHVTPYIYEHADQFNVRHVRAQADYSYYRWTLDTPEDLAFLRA